MEFLARQKRKTHPKDKSNIISKIFFLYTIGQFKKGYRKDLEEDDLYHGPAEFRSNKLGDVLEKEWEKQKRIQKKQSIVRLLLKCYGIPYLLLGCIQLVKDVAETVIPPYAMGKLVSYFTPGQTGLTRQDAYFYAAILIGVTLLEKIWRNNFIILLATLGIKMRSAFSSLLYRKILKLSPGSFGDISVGNVVTLITKDVNTFADFLDFGNDLWVGPVKAIVVSYVLYKRVGVAAFIGFSSFAVIIPLQIYIGTRITALKMKMCKKTDERLQVTHETLSAIRIIKMYAWESFFKNKIYSARKKEVYATYKIFLLKFVVHILGILNSHLSFYILMMAYVWLGNDVTAEIVYFIKTSFDSVSYGLAFFLPLGIFQGAELKAAVKRLGRIMKAEELQTQKTETHSSINHQLPNVVLSNVTVKLGNQKILNQINLKIRNNGLTLITGPVGSGKSLLLKTIIRDYEPEQGIFKVEGRVSYASQEPWLFPSTVRQNILFGEKYDEKRYQEVLNVCALDYDLELLDAGDNTIVEDRGGNLSKGQQARINLARAIYKDCDIYVLDDPLAALDIHVRKYIFQDCIKKFLRNKLVIMATNDATCVKNADTTMFMSKGGAQSTSKHSQLKQEQNLSENKAKPCYDQDNGIHEKSELIDKVTTQRGVYKETKKSGKVDYSVYNKYIKHCGGIFVMFLVLCVFISSQFTISYVEKVVSKWVDLEEKIFKFESGNSSNATIATQLTDMRQERTIMLVLYNILMAALVATTLGRTIALVIVTRKASIRLHKDMIKSIIDASMQFFDKHFIGNILNRFSKDLTIVDETLPLEIDYTFEVILYVAGTTTLIASVDTMFIIVTAVYFGILFFLKGCCIQTLRSLKRLDLSTRSPVVGHMNATIEGLTTIRALNTEKILQDEFDRHQDLYNSTSFTLKSSLRGFSFLLEVISVFFVGSIIVKFLAGNTEHTAGDVGLAISHAMYLASTLQWVIREWIEVENQMTSVERVLEYTDIKQENRQGLQQPDWPHLGRVKYENVSLSYTDSGQHVLKNINFTVLPREKIGIVGRTGAGKSSIISTLFRLYDAEGTVTIDDVETKTLALDYLRSNISIIPQDPVLFSGTVRENVDPLRKYSDEEIWKGIDAANLTDLIPSLDLDIRSSNFSIGQKQLICIARAVLRKNKIIVLDEATANMDSATDSLIHQTVIQNFGSCTVFVVTHKLDKIFNFCDKVMVLNQGKITEYDSPKNLLKNKDGDFYRMVASAEPQILEQYLVC